MFSFFQKKQAQVKEPVQLSSEEATIKTAEGDNWYFGKCGCSVDKHRALVCYEQAGTFGNTRAQVMAGYMYANGDGIAADISKAIQWYTAASDAGDDNATLNLANIYLLGEGVPVDKNKGCSLLKKAAERGNAIAASSLGREYTIGDALPLSITEAEYWIKKAEERGYVNSATITNLGLLYEGERKYEKAFECFSKAIRVNPNDTNAQYLYAQYKFRGRGTTADLKDARNRIEWVVKEDPTDTDAANFLQIIMLKEAIVSALELTEGAQKNQYQIWDYRFGIFVGDAGFNLHADFSGNGYENSECWNDFKSHFSLIEEGKYGKYSSSYGVKISLTSTLYSNFSILKGIVESLQAVYTFLNFEYKDTWISITWRLDQ